MSGLEDTPLGENMILHNMKTKTTRTGKLVYDSGFVTLCAEAVAEYFKNNPQR